MTDHLTGIEVISDKPPHPAAFRPKVGDGVVIVAKQPARLFQGGVTPGPFRPRMRGADSLPSDIGDDLSPPCIEAQRSRAVAEAGAIQVAEQLVNGGRPRTGRAANGVSDTHDSSDVPTLQRLLGGLAHEHKVDVRPDAFCAGSANPSRMGVEDSAWSLNVPAQASR